MTGQAFAELLAEPGVVEVGALRSTFGFLAFHGGGLEEVTDVVASRAAEASGASYYGVLHPPGWKRHLPSIQVDPAGSPALAAFLAHVDVAIAVHGYGRNGWWTRLLAGGTNRALAEHVAACLAPVLPDYEVVTDLDVIPKELRGVHARNPVNRPRLGGVQLELPPRVRGRAPSSPPPGPDGLSPPTAALIAGLADAARTWSP
ncbi:poly-gamma-glutamate hydrolase family protein [Aquihabitans sp. G128]|uniref:poly-gamma-glutamate hydrolase family protein n=1 Tax=Aquihabitans sp. G128 TaxID=2849779 RepID=UPI001C249822|nr:poly-gamma-glutamate hydrolase family protein [Aquihabitans sp. G128]QXC59439.1 poly-gamma-glutamate hydrolase family protein [Aquihabitans sp. G128]